MVDYCHTPQCLRAFILHYFGEIDVNETCDNCSNCKIEGEFVDITIEAQKILSCVYRVHERFGVKDSSRNFKRFKKYTHEAI